MAKTIDGGRIVFTIDENGSLVKLGKLADVTGKKIGKGGLGKNVQETDRLYKSLSHQTSNSTKEFAKQAQTMQGGLVAAYAVIAAQVFALGAAFRFMEQSFNVRNLVEGQKMFGAITGNAFQTITTNVQQAAGNMLKFQDAASGVAIGVAAGLSSSQLERLGAAAKNTSLALGRDLTDSYNRLIRGVTKAEPELLDELGIVLRLEPALKKYALQIGKSAKDLTIFEKSQAVANEVLTQAETKFGRIAEIMDPSAFALQQFQKEFDDLVKGFKVGLANVLIPLFGFLKDNVLALVGTSVLFLRPILRNVLATQNFGASAQKAFESAEIAVAKAKMNLDAYTSSLERARGSTAAMMRETALSTLTGAGINFAPKQGFKGGEGQLSAAQIRSYRTSVQKGIGVAADFTPEMSTAFASFLDDQEAALNKSVGVMGRIWKGFALGFDKVTASMKLKWKLAHLEMSKVTTWFVGKVDKIMKGIAILAIAGIIFDVLKGIYNFLFPVSEAVKKAAEETENVVSSLSTLTTELERMNMVADEKLLNVTDSIIQVGSAMQSYDIVKRISDFNKELAKGMTAETRQGFVDAALQVEQLDTRFEGLADQFRSDTSIETQGNKFIELANKVQEASIATKNFADVQRATDQSIKGLLGKYKLPFEDQIQNFRKETEEFEKLSEDMAAKAAKAQQTAPKPAALLKLQQGGFLTAQDVQNMTEAQLNELYRMATGSQRDFKGVSGTGAMAFNTTTYREEVSPEFLRTINQYRGEGLKLTQEGVNLLGAEEERQKGINTEVNEYFVRQAKIERLHREFLKLQEKGLGIQRDRNKQSRDEVQQTINGNEYNMLLIKQANDLANKKLDIRSAELEIETTSKILAEARKEGNAEEIKAAEAAVRTAVELLELETKRKEEIEKRFEIAKKNHQLEQIQARDRMQAVKGNLLMGSSMGQRMMEFSKSTEGQGYYEAGGVQAVIDAAIAQEHMNIQLETTLGIGARLTDGFANDFANSLVAVAEGTKTLKEAFGDMARSIIADITKMVIKALILEAILAAIKMMSGGTSGPVSDFFTKALGGRDGGIMSSPGYRSFGDGGVTTGPESGYPATLHGTEAVVPLPNNRSIPVEMKGGMGNVNNVNVNIDMQNGSSNITADQGNAFGAAISAAVIDEIAKQQRSGGLLSGG